MPALCSPARSTGSVLLGPGSMIATPLLHGGRAVGLLLLYGDKPGIFGERELTLACGFSVTAADWHTVCVNPLGLRVFTLGMTASGSVTAERGASRAVCSAALPGGSVTSTAAERLAR